MIKKRLFYGVLIVLFLGIICFTVHNNLVLDKSDKEVGIHDFSIVQTEVILRAKGTGEQIIKSEGVYTSLNVLEVLENKSNLNLIQGNDISPREYLELIDNYRTSSFPYLGRSVYGMGTGYKRLEKDEVGKVYLHYDKQTDSLWIVPEKLTK